MLTSWQPRVFVLLFIAGLIVACASQPAPPEATALLPATAAVMVVTPIHTATAPAQPTVQPTATTVPIATPQPTATPQPIFDPITGAPALARGAVTQRPYIVMIDNHPDAYPQTGLDHAAVVFEALAEFGVTRFMAVYVPGITLPVARIGPVRSTRLYFAQLAMGFHPIYAHAGGSPQGLELVESTDQLVNLDALHDDTVMFFWRSRDRVAPHNLYINTDMITQAAKKRGIAPLSDPNIGFLFKPDMQLAQRPTKQQLAYYFIYPEDPAGWRYDPKTNGYLRLRRGVPAYDAVTGKQLWSKDVVVMEAAEQQIVGDEKGRIDQQVLGAGQAQAFIDGSEQDIIWRKADATAPLRFYNTSGDELQLNAGPVWIVIVPSLKNLTVR